MAIITPDTFNPLQRFVGVRLQQGVPIVDADWNELEDIRKFEVRAFLKWFVGDGVPEGNDGFRVEGDDLDNDFWIRVGVSTLTGVSSYETGLRHTGRCIVDGLDVLIEEDILFSAQPLQTAAEQSRLAPPNVDVIAPLTTPTADGTLLVYLDVWERLLTPQQQPSLINSGLGVESCARVIREWVVRVRSDTEEVPQPTDADFKTGHSYYALASIARRSGVSKIKSGDIRDLRERRLLVPPATLIEDLFGVSSMDYRRGQGRPAVSFREAINSLLRALMNGERHLSTPEATVSGITINFSFPNGFFIDSNNVKYAIWAGTSSLSGSLKIYAARLDQNNITGGFSIPLQITDGTSPYNAACVDILPDGQLIVVYCGYPSGDIKYRIASYDNLSIATESTLAMGSFSFPNVVVTQNIITYFYHDQATGIWYYRRYNHNSGGVAPADSASLPLIPDGLKSPDYMSVAKAKSDNIWLSVRATDKSVLALMFNPITGNVSYQQKLSTPNDDDPTFIISCANGDVFVFWNDNKIPPLTSGLYYAKFTSGSTNSWGLEQMVPGTAERDIMPIAVEDAGGRVLLFWTRRGIGVGDDLIYFQYYDTQTNRWGQPVQLTIGIVRSVMRDSDNNLWVYFSKQTNYSISLEYKKIVLHF